MRSNQSLADFIRHIQSLPLLRLRLLSPNTLDKRPNCRHNHVLEANEAFSSMAAGNPSHHADSLLHVHAVEALVHDGHFIRLLLRPVLRHFRPLGLLRRPLLPALFRAVLLR